MNSSERSWTVQTAYREATRQNAGCWNRWRQEKKREREGGYNCVGGVTVVLNFNEY